MTHQRSTDPCQLRSPTQMEGIDDAQEARLRSRRRTDLKIIEAKMCRPEISKWRSMYMIIFPDVSTQDIPSPC